MTLNLRQEEAILNRKYVNWLALRAIMVVLAGSLIMSCATSTGPAAFQSPQKTQAKSVLETCAVVQDQELAEMRGCYDIYSFGMNMELGFDLAKKSFTNIKTDYKQVTSADQIPSNLKVNDSGTQVAFNNGSVAYTAGVGQNSLGTGIMQVIQVAGSNVIVMANMNVTMNFSNAGSKIVPTAGSMLPAAMSGLIR
jgi:hypothetical protein